MKRSNMGAMLENPKQIKGSNPGAMPENLKQNEVIQSGHDAGEPETKEGTERVQRRK